MENTHGTITKKPGGYEIKFERWLPYAISDVWDALTNPEILPIWLAKVICNWRAGDPIEFHFTNTGDVNKGNLVAIEKPSRLEYTWIQSEGHVSIITWELHAEPSNKTRLILTHSRLKGDANSFAAGWHVHLHLLSEALAGRLTQFEWSDDEYHLEYAWYAGDIA